MSDRALQRPEKLSGNAASRHELDCRLQLLTSMIEATRPFTEFIGQIEQREELQSQIVERNWNEHSTPGSPRRSFYDSSDDRESVESGSDTDTILYATRNKLREHVGRLEQQLDSQQTLGHQLNVALQEEDQTELKTEIEVNVQTEGQAVDDLKKAGIASENNGVHMEFEYSREFWPNPLPQVMGELRSQSPVADASAPNSTPLSTRDKELKELEEYIEERNTAPIPADKPLSITEMETKLGILTEQCQAYQRMILIQLNTLHRLQPIFLQQTHASDWSMSWRKCHVGDTDDTDQSRQSTDLLETESSSIDQQMEFQRTECHSPSSTSLQLYQHHTCTQHSAKCQEQQASPPSREAVPSSWREGEVTSQPYHSTLHRPPNDPSSAANIESDHSCLVGKRTAEKEKENACHHTTTKPPRQGDEWHQNS